jgi:hypothetical protein
MYEKIFRALVHALVPVFKIIGQIHMPLSHKLVTDEDYYEARALIKPGYIVLTKTRGELTNLTIPGFWKHGGMYLGDDGEKEWMIDAIGTGINPRTLVKYLMTRDYFVVLKCKLLTDADHKEAADAFNNLRGQPYDFEFMLDEVEESPRQIMSELVSGNSKRPFYCFEAVWFVLSYVYGKPIFSPKVVCGQPSIVGESFINPDLFQVVWSSKSTPEETVKAH